MNMWALSREQNAGEADPRQAEQEVMQAKVLILSAALFAGMAISTQAADTLKGDPKAGEIVFNQCRQCHHIGPGATNFYGPVLNGLIGRPAGSVPGYNYSEANKHLRQGLGRRDPHVLSEAAAARRAGDLYDLQGPEGRPGHRQRDRLYLAVRHQRRAARRPLRPASRDNRLSKAAGTLRRLFLRPRLPLARRRANSLPSPGPSD